MGLAGHRARCLSRWIGLRVDRQFPVTSGLLWRLDAARTDTASIRRSERHTARADAGAYPESRRRRAAGYFAAFFLRAAQEAFIRSDTASFSLAVIGRRFLTGVASDAVSATGVAAAAGRREEERRAAGFAGAEVPRILSTSFNALISACRRSISLCRAAIAFAITLEPLAKSVFGRVFA